MAELSEFPTASAKDTISFCWKQVEGQKRPLITSWVVMVLAVVMADVVCPLIFASILGAWPPSRRTRRPASGTASARCC